MLFSLRKILFFVLVTIILLIPCVSESQYFGQNKVNYTPFDWQSVPTEHFDIYFTGGGYETALLASVMAEKAYTEITEHWDYIPKRRIPIIVYNSHNDFSQTNVIMETIEEGTGGFTEIFKNRVVIPWEGSLDKFEHVIHHELTHAVMFDMVYGGLMESIIGRDYLFQMPLWFAEGLAEHESQYWSTEADMVVRDGIISGYLPDIQNTYGGYLVYKGGESFFKFIQEQYGSSEKWIAGELLKSLKMTKNIDKSYKDVVGKSVEDLSKEWQRKLREEHWPDVKDREMPDDFATKLTDHRKLNNYLNIDPVFNPTGDKIAFLTDRNDYKEVMIMSAIDGRLLDITIKGEKAGGYEEMHWLRGGITWSPDGKMIAFSTKAGRRDAINIQKLEDGGFEKTIVPKMDAVYSPNWSPDGSMILFCGIKDGKLDLFTVDVKTEKYNRLTNDFFDEFDPKWSPDGKKIVFASDRIEAPYNYTIDMADGNYDIFTVNSDGTGIERITSGPFNDRNPDWSPDSKNIVFSSDRNGIVNIYMVNLEEMSVRPLTNILTAVSGPAWSPDGDKIAFSSFGEGGWDIYILKRPLKRDLTIESISPTAYRTETLEAIDAPDTTTVILSDDGMGQQVAAFKIHPREYKLKFSPDMFNAFASYNTFMGLGGQGYVSLSDVMGNHRVNFAGNLFYSLEESNIMLSYMYMKRQTNYGIGIYHYKNYYYSSNWDIFSDRIYGGTLLLSRPFDKFRRIETNLNFVSIQRDTYTSSIWGYDPYGMPIYGEAKRLEGVRSITIQTDFIKDNVLWGYTGPINGSRYKLDVEYSPKISSSNLSYTTAEVDFRKYFRFARNYNFVSKFGFGGSFGEEPRMFFLGGIDNWLNARVARIDNYIEESKDLYFSRYPFPLRGYNYYEVYGRKYFLANFEFRFPFIRYLAMGWPIPIVIGNITGTMFTDIAAAWENKVLGPDGKTAVIDKSFHGGGVTDNGSLYLDDIKMSFGFGMRMNLGFAVVRLDTAWRTTLEKTDKKPMFSISVGPEF